MQEGTRGAALWAARLQRARSAVTAQSYLPLGEEELAELALAHIRTQNVWAGRKGFRITLERKGAATLAKKLGASFERKYGKPLDLAALRDWRSARVHRQARAQIPEGTLCPCGRLATVAAHTGGSGMWKRDLAAGVDPNGPGKVVPRCDACHKRMHGDLADELAALPPSDVVTRSLPLDDEGELPW